MVEVEIKYVEYENDVKVGNCNVNVVGIFKFCIKEGR